MTKHTNLLGRFTLLVCMFALTLGISGCTKPEIGVVLDGYCSFQKTCDFATVNTETQYHDFDTCDTFHHELLENTANGKTGCQEEVEDFFIFFMDAQMEYGCDATLVETLNKTPKLQNQLQRMLTCVKEKNAETSENINAEMAQMGLNVLNTLEINIFELDPKVLQMIMGTVTGK